MKVWIVTTGCYSDFSIERVFSSEEKGDEYCSTLGEYERRDCRVNEWDVDAPFTPDEVSWNIWFHADGSLFGVWRNDDDWDETWPLNHFETKMHGSERIWFGRVRARTEEAAIKIGAEYLTMNRAHLAGMG
jgi:hypothetical protein